MEFAMNRNLFVSFIYLMLGAVILTACDDSPKNIKITSGFVKKYAQLTSLEGIVRNNKDIIKTGQINATDENGQLIVHSKFDNGHFTIDIPANTGLPILLLASSETDSDQWIVAVVDDNISQYQINPTTTAIAKAAKAMGGYTRANLVRAAEETVHVPDANKTSTGWRGDPTTQYGGWH
jgi:hypothetical protein